MPDNAQIEAEIRQWIAAGKKIAAIKVARQYYNLGLKEAKEVIDALAAGDGGPLAAAQQRYATWASKQGAAPESPQQADPPTAAQSGEIEDMVRETIATRGMIYAIKLYRDRTGASLRESKAAVEHIARQAPPREADDDYLSGPVSERRDSEKRGCLSVLVIAGGLVFGVLASLLS